MTIIKTFESFNDPNKKPVGKIQISNYITKTDFFALKTKPEKEFIKKSLNVEFDKFSKNERGDYVIVTGDSAIKEITIPKKLIIEVVA